MTDPAAVQLTWALSRVTHPVSGGATAHPTTGHCRTAKVNRTDGKWFCLNDLRGKDNGREIAEYLAQVSFPRCLASGS
jgi:hypothetical protein